MWSAYIAKRYAIAGERLVIAGMREKTLQAMKGRGVERGAVPDLVGIVADSGIDGYAYWEQFDAEDASDAIPVYAEDGTTQRFAFLR